jgi:hypothetical protein
MVILIPSEVILEAMKIMETAHTRVPQQAQNSPPPLPLPTPNPHFMRAILAGRVSYLVVLFYIFAGVY